MATSNEVNWDPSIWQEINDAVVKEISKARVAQQVFHATAFDDRPTEVTNDVIDFTNLSIKEGQTKSYVELYQEFSLTSTQVAKEAERKTCKTLARMAAKALALAEDSVFFRGVNAVLGGVQADHLESAGNGLLGEANPGPNGSDEDPTKVSVPIVVPRVAGRPGVLYGENVFSAVADGIAKLSSKTQAPNYALFLPVGVYADTSVPPGQASLVTTHEAIETMVKGGFYGTGTLPGGAQNSRGLLVALAGDPTVLYVGLEATTEFLRKERANYVFRVVERVQFVVRDPRALVLLEFA